jgi:hypothetical protein
MSLYRLLTSQFIRYGGCPHIIAGAYCLPCDLSPREMYSSNQWGIAENRWTLPRRWIFEYVQRTETRYISVQASQSRQETNMHFSLMRLSISHAVPRTLSRIAGLRCVTTPRQRLLTWQAAAPERINISTEGPGHAEYGYSSPCELPSSVKPRVYFSFWISIYYDFFALNGLKQSQNISRENRKKGRLPSEFYFILLYRSWKSLTSHWPINIKW